MNLPENLDPDMKNIIDKLANFVARNGPQFEEMTKQKQKDNPKFSFLFGGEFYTYYKFKVASEIAMMNQSRQQEQMQQQQMQGQMPGQIPGQMPGQIPGQMPGQMPHQMPQQQAMQLPPQMMPPHSGSGPMGPQPGGNQWQANTQLQEQIAQAKNQVNTLQSHVADQVKQSESNLAAQYTVLMQQQQTRINDMVSNSLEDKLNSLLAKCQLNIAELNDLVQPIIESCTKDAILNGKNWIMHRINDEFCDAISQYFLKRITAKEAPFTLRLHLIYLINDVLHHCVRRNIEVLRKSLETVVVPIFCTSSLSADTDKIEKLNKLLALWEKNKYFSPDTLEKMKDPSGALSNYQANLITENASAVTAITAGVQQQYSSLEKQHQEFVSHLNQQVTTAQQQLNLLVAQAASQEPPQNNHGDLDGPMPQNLPPGPAPYHEPPFSREPPSGPNIYEYGPPPNQQPQSFDYNHGSNMGPGPAGGMMPRDMPPGGPPPMGPDGMLLPGLDFSKPPPGFPPLGPGGMPPFAPPDIDLTPSVPYYELPAGLIAPLIRLEDFDYKSLDPKDIRLPPPMPPSERLIAAVEAFYQQPSRERPRDGDGWEKLGLYEFFRAKQRAKNGREDLQSPSRSPDQGNNPPRRRFASEERRSRSRSRSRSESRSQSRSRSRSRSPTRSRSSSRSGSPVRRRSPTRSRSASPLPYIRTSMSPSPPPQTHQPHQPQRPMERERSATPPSFGASFAQQPPDGRLGEENKGHQLLKKMGWGGRGLGAGEQGRQDPVEAADVRDRQDMHKGIGMDLRDPFEAFRKNKSQGFIHRMKTRDEERERRRKADSTTEKGGVKEKKKEVSTKFI